MVSLNSDLGWTPNYFPGGASFVIASPTQGNLFYRPQFQLHHPIMAASSIHANPSTTSTGHALNFSANAGLLSQSPRRKNIDDSRYAKRHSSAEGIHELPANFNTLGHASEIQKLAVSSASSTEILSPRNNGVALNIVTQCRDSLPSVAAGVQCYSAFCDLVGAAYFPPTYANVKRWGSLFNHGKTFGLYVNHLVKGCQISDIATDWDNSIRAADKGLQNIQDLSVKFDNFAPKEIFVALIRHEGLDTEIGRLFYVAFIFLLRVQSEGLPMQRASSSDRLLDKSPISAHPIIGLRYIAGEDRLVLKLKTRRNVRHGSVLTRPCFCSGNIIAGKGMCPIHDFRPAVRRATPIGSPLFDGIRRRNLNRIPKASLTSLDVIDANRYSVRCFRRLRIMGIKRPGPTLGVILGSG